MPTIQELQLEVEKLNKQLTRYKKQLKDKRYGLVWLDVPEAFEEESENQMPVLEEVQELAIKNDDGKPTHILIEGDNYHALTCLNYTHKGKIDLIYIDPPYNTGSDGFKYKDKRVLDKFPDGSDVPKNHPLRHSYWLSFMSKRLELAKNLLRKSGVIFISVDDNENYQLKLLCDKIFGEENFIGNLPRITKSSGKTTNKIALNHDYLLIYCTDKSKAIINGTSHNDKGFKNKDDFFEERGFFKLNQTLDYDSLQYSQSLDYEIEIDGVKFVPGSDIQKYKERKEGKYNRADWAWRWSKDLFEFGLKNGFIVVKKTKKSSRIYTKTYLKANIIKSSSGVYSIELYDRQKPLTSIQFTDSLYSNDNAKKDLHNVVNKTSFDYPKPLSLVKDVVSTNDKKNLIVLDFFAGSGTTAQSVLELNEDNLNRQFILVTNNENNICSDVTYPRISNVIQGWNNNKGIGNSLKYYKTTFVGKHNIKGVTDEDKAALALKCGYLLAITENTLEETEHTKYQQHFTNGKHNTAIYFQENLKEYQNFFDKVAAYTIPTTIYLFSWEDDNEFEQDYLHILNITVKSIPKPIVEIYKNIFNLDNNDINNEL